MPERIKAEVLLSSSGETILTITRIEEEATSDPIRARGRHRILRRSFDCINYGFAAIGRLIVPLAAATLLALNDMGNIPPVLTVEPRDVYVLAPLISLAAIGFSYAAKYSAQELRLREEALDRYIKMPKVV